MSANGGPASTRPLAQAPWPPCCSGGGGGEAVAVPCPFWGVSLIPARREGVAARCCCW